MCSNFSIILLNQKDKEKLKGESLWCHSDEKSSCNRHQEKELGRGIAVAKRHQMLK